MLAFSGEILVCGLHERHMPPELRRGKAITESQARRIIAKLKKDKAFLIPARDNVEVRWCAMDAMGDMANPPSQMSASSPQQS